jgi:hypothetical protein
MPFDQLPRTTCESPRPRPAPETLVSGISRPRSTKTNSREKVFREKRGIPLDREAKVRIMAYARGYNAKHRREGQHQGPITWAFLRVLKTMLWEFHNNRTGYCFPSYETIAEKARCCRDTVYEAIRVLEASGILDWVNRFDKIFKHGAWQVIRTSNAYLFRDPLPCGNTLENPNRSENPAGTLHNQEKILKIPPENTLAHLPNSLIEALIDLGRNIGAIPT